MAHPRISASAPTSRRSSYGSHFNVNKETASPSHNANNNNATVGVGAGVGEGSREIPQGGAETDGATSGTSPTAGTDAPDKADDGEPVDETKVFNRVSLFSGRRDFEHNDTQLWTVL